MGEILANLEDLALEDDEALYCTLPVHDGEISDQDSDISDIERRQLESPWSRITTGRSACCNLNQK